MPALLASIATANWIRFFVALCLCAQLDITAHKAQRMRCSSNVRKGHTIQFKVQKIPQVASLVHLETIVQVLGKKLLLEIAPVVSSANLVAQLRRLQVPTKPLCVAYARLASIVQQVRPTHCRVLLGTTVLHQ
jgi:hypothetical protein